MGEEYLVRMCGGLGWPGAPGLVPSPRHSCLGGPPGVGPREGGANPPRPRHCNRGRNPREATGPAGSGPGRRGE